MFKTAFLWIADKVHDRRFWMYLPGNHKFGLAQVWGSKLPSLKSTVVLDGQLLYPRDELIRRK